MKTQKITPPSGYEIDKDKSTFEEIVFKPNWVNSWEELGIKEYNLTVSGKEEYHIGFMRCPATFNNNVSKYMNIQKLIDLRDHVNCGYDVSWEYSGLEKYCIHLYDKEITIESWYVASRLLYFKDKKIAERFLETHRELIESVKEFL